MKYYNNYYQALIATDSPQTILTQLQAVTKQASVQTSAQYRTALQATVDAACAVFDWGLEDDCKPHDAFRAIRCNLDNIMTAMETNLALHDVTPLDLPRAEDNGEFFHPIEEGDEE